MYDAPWARGIVGKQVSVEGMDQQTRNGRSASAAEVAALAGVSRQTVSRVVNGMPNVTEKTRKRVLAAMEELGFRPNFAGAALRGGSYRSIGPIIFLGHYSARTLSLINEILRANNATLTVEDSDMEELAKAAPRNDMFGLNYYQSAFIAAYDGESTNSFNGTGDKGTSCFKFKGVGQQVDMPGIPTTDWDWLIYPQGLYDTLKHISATYPNLPVIYITENGLGHKDPEPDANGIVADPERIDFVDQHMEKVLQARAEGVDVQGYFIWSLQDQFSWANGYNKRYGLFYIDFDTQKRYIKQSALWYKELADTMADAQ